MPEYLHPGVYIEEQPAPQTIEGVSTSTAGFVGATQMGPTGGLPVLVTSFAEFRRIFGGYLSRDTWGDYRFLPHAVEGFFANGGQRVYVKRVIDQTSDEPARAATVEIGDGFVTRLREDTAAADAERNVVRLVSMRGIDTTVTLTFTQEFAGEVVTNERKVVSYRTERGGTVAVTLSGALTSRYTRDGCLVTINGTSPPVAENPTRGLKIDAASAGQWGNRVLVTTIDADGAVGIAESTGASTTLKAIAVTDGLAFPSVTDGPEERATEIALKAGDGAKLRHGDVVEFRNPNGQHEARRIAKNGNTISWAGDDPDQGPLAFAYDTDGSTVSLLTAIRGPVDLAFAASGPDVSAQDVLLSIESAKLLDVGDRVAFRNAAGVVEVVVLTSSDAATGKIAWTGGLTGTFKAAGSTARRVTVDPVINVERTTGLGESDLLRVLGGGDSQVLEVASGATAVVDGEGTIKLATGTWAIEGAYLAGDALAYAVAGKSGTKGIDLRSVRNFYAGAVIEIDDGQVKHYHTVESIDGQSLVLVEALTASVPSGAAVRAVEFTLRVDIQDESTTELFPNLSLSETASNYVTKVITEETSRIVRVTVEGVGPPPFHLPRTTTGLPVNLANGADGGIPSLGDYRGVDGGPNNRSGIKGLADIDQISIIAAPGIADASVHNELIEQCSLLKDRFAVIDPRPGSSIGGAADLDIGTQRGQYDTLYAAMYYPWMKIPDPLAPPDRPATMDVPPSGHIVGLYARVDVERGVHKAPANEVVRGITGLELKLTDRDQDILNPLHVNVIRDFRESQRGVRVWGSRCLTSDSAWKYVPVRRLFIFIEESLDEGLQWVVFEPNDERLWARVRQTVTGFLRRIWRDGALAGVTEEEAFFVRCDRSTMTEDDLRSGRLIILVAARPVFPAEFVIVRISQKTLEAAS